MNDRVLEAATDAVEAAMGSTGDVTRERARIYARAALSRAALSVAADLREFREQGFLQEANRLFFHPRGLALSMTLDTKTDEPLGLSVLSTDDPEGFVFDGWEADDFRRAANVAAVRETYRKARTALFRYGGVVEPCGWKSS